VRPGRRGEVDAVATHALVDRHTFDRLLHREQRRRVGDLLQRLQLSVYWNFKKVVKRIGGNAWLQFRKAVLARRPWR